MAVYRHTGHAIGREALSRRKGRTEVGKDGHIDTDHREYPHLAATGYAGRASFAISPTMFWAFRPELLAMIGYGCLNETPASCTRKRSTTLVCVHQLDALFMILSLRVGTKRRYRRNLQGNAGKRYVSTCTENLLCFGRKADTLGEAVGLQFF